MKFVIRLTLALLFLISSSSLFADTKVKTRMTTMGHATESSVFIKGARKRDEMQFGPIKSVTILQCDQKRMITEIGRAHV